MTLLRNNKHHCENLQKDSNVVGEKAFKVEIIAQETPSPVLTKEKMLELEKFFISNEKNPYNTSRVGKRINIEPNIISENTKYIKTFADIVFFSQMKKEDIIEQSGIPRAYFYKALKGKHKFKESHIERLSLILKISQTKIREAQG